MIALKISNFGRICSNHLLNKVSTLSLLRTLSHYFEPILNGEGEDSAEISSCNSREQGLISVLQPCSTMRELYQIHGLILKSGFAQYVYVVGRLISFCAVSELGSMEHAAAVFDDLEFPDGFIYNTMIRGFVRTRNKYEALRYFKRMKKLHKPVDNFTFSFILKLCADSAMVGLGRQVHCSVLKDGYELHTFVRNTLIHMYAMFRHLAHARRLFEEMPTKDLISWNVFIDGLVHCKQYNDALRTFLRMQQSGFSPDAATYVEVLSACAGLGDLGFGEMVHSKISIYVLNDFILVSNSLISMYSKCGAINKAILVFEGMKERNTVSWNSMILGLAMHGRAHEALQLFDEMRLRGLDKPNGITFLGVLCACSHGGLVNEGKEHFRSMKQDYCIDPSVHHYGCMVDLLGRTGLLREAYELIRSMPSEGNVVVWRTLLGACRIHGDLEMGEVARKELMKLVPDHSGDFVLLSHLYAMVGQWDEVLSIRQDMLGMGAMKPQSGNSLFDFRHSGEIGEMVKCTPGRP